VGVPEPKSIGDVLHALVHAWAPLKEPDIPCGPKRFGYAFAGAVPWILYNLNDTVTDALPSLGTGELAVSVGLQLLLAGWFAWLISWQKRPCPPSRLFLEGMTFPAFTLVLLTSGLSLFELIGG